MEAWTVGGTRITRVPEPGFDLIVPQDEATTRVLRSHSSWLAPHFVTDATELRIGSSAIIVRADDTVVVVDPWLAFDGPDRFAATAVDRVGRLLGALAATGVSADDVDVVVDTHVDGLGANTVPADGRERAAFPHARYLLAEAELATVRAGRRPNAQAFVDVLMADDLLDVVSPGHRITNSVVLEEARGHSPGHLAVRVDSAGERAVIAGHLFLHPAQVASPGPRADLDEDPEVASRSRRALLERCAADHTLLIGPLFAAPGAGWVVAAGDGWRLEPALPSSTA